jgi:hypothetical protein
MAKSFLAYSDKQRRASANSTLKDVRKLFKKLFKVFKQVATKYLSKYLGQCLSLLGLETPCNWLLR